MYASSGALLVSIDFKNMYPQIIPKLFTIFDEFVTKIKPIYDEEIKYSIFSAEWKTFNYSECDQGNKN